MTKFIRITEEKRNWIAGISLFVVTMILYWPTIHFPFVSYDDEVYVAQNPVVLKGLSWTGIKYAFASNVSGNWHPLTMLSLMADASVYGSFAGGYHLTNILLHAINVVLLWILIRRMTGLFWPGVLVAVLFAVHPLNAESVAWIAERKNVLSTFFFILTVLAYMRYAENPRPTRYLLTLILFVLGLMAKAMLVTLPFLLFLLDYWPLQRIFPAQNSSKADAVPDLRRLVWEKIPFLAVTVVDCVITYFTQVHAGAVASLAERPFESRALNIPLAYLTYVEKSFWPSNLCVLYAFPEKQPVAPVVISLALLVTGTVAAWHWRWKFRWLIVGWLWFLGMLVPVIGIVQAGPQAWANHYAYVPTIGIFLIAGCALTELWRAWRPLRACLVLAPAGFLCVCVFLARQQMDCWRNSVALFSQAIAVNPNNTAARELYGLALVKAGQFAEAIAPLETVLKEEPNDPGLRNTLGVALSQTGKSHEAENQFNQAIALRPNYPKSYFNLGEVLLKEDRPKAAITNFLTALRVSPNWPQAMERLAAAYAADGDSSNAVSTANRALALANADYQTELANEISAELDRYQPGSLSGKTYPKGKVGARN